MRDLGIGMCARDDRQVGIVAARLHADLSRLEAAGNGDEEAFGARKPGGGEDLGNRSIALEQFGTVAPGSAAAFPRSVPTARASSTRSRG